MDPIIGGAAYLLGNVVSGLFGSSAQDKANEQNRQIAYDNREFQKEMSSSAYQRAAIDMKAAGLNPIAGVTPASTPTPNTPVMEASNPMSGLGPGIGGGVNTAMSIMQTTADVDAKTSQKALTDSQKLTEDARTLQTANSAKESEIRMQKMIAEMPASQAKAKFEKEQSEIDRENIIYDNIMKRAQQATGVGASAMEMLNPLKGLFKGKQGSKSSTFEEMFKQWQKERKPLP